MSEIYLWSDTHFNHRGIIDYCQRPYKNVEEMNEDLIALWNNKVGQQDTIYHLGDFGFHNHSEGYKLEEIFSRLQGHKHLLVGNHDEKNPQVLRLPWESQSQIKTLELEGARMELCHYPMVSWKNMHRDSVHAHGHCHGSLKVRHPRRFDVGIDALGEKGPIRAKHLYDVALTYEFEPTDGHRVNHEESM